MRAINSVKEEVLINESIDISQIQLYITKNINILIMLKIYKLYTCIVPL